MLTAPTHDINDDRLPWIPGSPRDDDRLRDWADSTLADWSRWAGRDLVPPWRFLAHLYGHLGGPLLPDGRSPIWRYRIRWLAVAYRSDPAAFDAEARSYLMAKFHANPH